MLAVLWFTLGLPGIYGVAAAIAVNMAIAYGLSYLGGVLFGQEPKEAAEAEPRGQSFAWNPHTTQQEGIPRPMCWGRNKHFGNIVMQWTDVDPVSGNEVLYKALDYGRGPVQGVVGGMVSDVNRCLGGTPEFDILDDSYIDDWYQTPANVNDNNRKTYVGFYGKEGQNHLLRGRFVSTVTFAEPSTVDRVEYLRYWHMIGSTNHSGYEKVSLYYGAAWHLISTRNITTEGENTDTVVIEAGGPWEGVTKIKIEIELAARGLYIVTLKEAATVHYKLYELRAWYLQAVPVFLNGQPAHNFKEVIIRGRPGTLNQTCMEGFEKNKLEYRSKTVIVYGEPVRWTSPNTFFDDIEFTLAFLNGLFYYTSDGGIGNHSVGIKVEISVRDAESWTTILDTTISAHQLKQLYKIYKVSELSFDCAHGTQYDLKFSKTTEDKSATRYGDEMQLRSVREVVDVAFTHPGRALLGVIAQGTERLQGQIDITWITDDRLVNVFNGDIWEIKWTRNRAWVTLDQLTQPVISGDGGANPWVVERYEGLDPSRIDLTFFYKWAQWCDEQVPSGIDEETEDRMPCDIICDQQTNVWSVAYEIAQIGRCRLNWQGAMLTGWIDKATDEPIDLITMDNTMARSWKSSYAGYGEMAGSVETFYKDAAQDYERKPRPVFNQNAGAYTRAIALEGVGVTSESLATRVGNHVLKRNELIKNINSVQMYKETLRYRLGRVVRIQCNVPNWGQAFRVVQSETNNTCELDRVILGVSPGDLFWVKTFDTVNNEVSLDSYTVQSVAGKVVTIAETWEPGCAPLKDHLAAIGIAGSIKLRRIIKIIAKSNNYFNLELETYDTVLFGSDDADPELTNPNYTQPVTELAIPVTRQTVTDLIQALSSVVPKVIKPTLFNCAWTGNDVDTITWAKLNPDDPILLIWLGEVYEITPDSTALEYVYWDSETPTVFLKTATPTTALAGGMYLVCTNKSGVAQPADMLQMTHGAVIQIGTLIAEQIIIGGIDALGLMNAPAEAGADVTGFNQGDINIDNITDGTTYKKYLNTEQAKLTGIEAGADVTGAHEGDIALANLGEKSLINLDDKSLANVDSDANTKLTGIETGADVTADHADDVVYRGNTPPAHKAGRVWYCLVNVSFNNYTLYKSTGAAWEKIGDETAQHQADIQLANLGEKSIDSLVNGTYAKMLANWRAGGDITKMAGGKIFTDSIVTASLAAGLITYTELRQIGGSEAVDTGCIRDDATRLIESTYISGFSAYLPVGSRLALITDSITSLGGLVVVRMQASVHNYDTAVHIATIGIYQGATLVYEWAESVGAGSDLLFTGVANFVAGSGAKTFTLEGESNWANELKAEKRYLELEESLGK